MVDFAHRAMTTRVELVLPAPPEQTLKAARVLSRNATDAAELTQWLDMFGIDLSALKEVRDATE